MATTKSKYDWKKTAWKFGKAAIFIIIAGVASVYGNSPYYLAIAPLLHGFENWLKHKDD